MKATRMHRPLLGLLGLLLSLTSCGPKAPAPQSRGVFVSIAPQGWAAKELMKGVGWVEVLAPPGSDPHTFEPTLGQMQAMSNAKALFLMGMPFEVMFRLKLRDTLPNLKQLDLRKGMNLLPTDPHVWLSPKEMLTMTRNMASELANLFPDQQEKIQANLKRVEAAAAEVQHALDEDLSPYQGKSFLTFHPFMAYLARDYGLKQIALEQEGQNPSPKQLIAYISLARKENIRAILVQQSMSQVSAKVLADSLGAKLLTVDEMGQDWPEMMKALGQQLAQAFEVSDT